VNHGAQEPREQPVAFLGTSRAAQEVRRLIERAARVKATVLITGESGTGKELVAQAIHEASPRRSAPFVAVNCASFPDTLIESELFGHEAGAFTGARDRLRGAFERSDGGTLFLDEVGDLSAIAQPKLLRILETGELTRIGGERSVRLDLRVVAATNQPLRDMSRRGAFREDLYYRLCVFEIHVPPLRERREDIPILAEHFARTLAHGMGRKLIRISDEALGRLCEYPWPGNVRQLRHEVESAMAMNSGYVLGTDCFDLESAPHAPGGLGFLLDRPYREAKEAFEKLYARHLLDTSGGNVTHAARRAGLARRSLYKLLHRLQLFPGGRS